MAAKHVAGVRDDPCGSVRWTAVQRTAPHGSHILATRFAATAPGLIFKDFKFSF